MADLGFTDAEKASLEEIVEMDFQRLDSHLDYLAGLSGPAYPAATVARVQADIVLWDSYKDKHIRAHPTATNLGGDKDTARNRSAIRDRVCRHLLLETNDGVRLVRG